MAVLFQLAAECGDDLSAARRLRDHFEGQTFTLQNGRSFRLTTDEISQDERGRWWVSLILKNGGRFLQVIDSPAVLAEAAKKLYERLSSAQGYRFAVVGFEVLQFNDVEALRGPSRPGLRGLVLSQQVFEELGRPAGFTEFSEGYLWFPTNFRFGTTQGGPAGSMPSVG